MVPTRMSILLSTSKEMVGLIGATFFMDSISLELCTIQDAGQPPEMEISDHTGLAQTPWLEDTTSGRDTLNWR
jgi:hypothetical protein